MFQKSGVNGAVFLCMSHLGQNSMTDKKWCVEESRCWAESMTFFAKIAVLLLIVRIGHWPSQKPNWQSQKFFVLQDSMIITDIKCSVQSNCTNESWRNWEEAESVFLTCCKRSVVFFGKSIFLSTAVMFKKHKSLCGESEVTGRWRTRRGSPGQNRYAALVKASIHFFGDFNRKKNCFAHSNLFNECNSNWIAHPKKF